MRTNPPFLFQRSRKAVSKPRRLRAMRVDRNLIIVIAVIAGLSLFFKRSPSGSSSSHQALITPTADQQSLDTNRVPVTPLSSLVDSSTQSTGSSPGVAKPLTLSMEELTSSIARIDAESDLTEKERLLNELVRKVPVGGIRTILEKLWGQELSAVGKELRLRLLRTWSETDPRSVGDWVLRQPPGDLRTQALGHVASQWADKDFAAAMSWSSQLPAGEEKQSVIMQVAYEGSRNAPLEAMKLATGLPPSSARDDLLAHVASQWAGQEPEAAAKWAHEIPDLDVRARLLGNVMVAWSDQNPAEAAAFASKSLSAEDSKDDIVVGIVQRWTQKDPATAAQWVENFPEGPVRNSALESLVQIWSDQDSGKVGQWLNDLPEGNSRDTSVAAYARKLTPLDPQLAVSWAESIGDAAVRSKELQSLGETWMRADPSAAAMWVEKSTLSEGIKARLLAGRSK